MKIKQQLLDNYQYENRERWDYPPLSTLTKYTAIIAIVKVNKFDSLQASLRDAIRKRMRGTAIAVEGARESLKNSRFYDIIIFRVVIVSR